jgi:filamentous hemagglutinin family protein
VPGHPACAYRSPALQNALSTLKPLVWVLATAGLLYLPAHAQLAAHALPTGGRVAAGSASISSAGSALRVDQSTNKAVIDWQSFNIGSGASVRFNQPSSSSITLNRVGADGGRSLIDGGLTANGQVWLLNPGGALFGPTANINVGGLLASSLKLGNDDFMGGTYRFSKDGAGSIINQGKLTAADGGYIALLAPEVRNEGVITARLGTVALASGDELRVDFTGDRLIEIRVDQSAVNGLIENKNLVETEGGWVLMSAGAASSLGAGGINNTGIVRALSLSEHAGVIRLEGGTTRVGGVLDVSALGGHGGTVQVLGQQVEVAGGARIDASGSNGGGTVLVGGDYQGQNTAVPNAKTTLVAATASLKADATVSGDGGKIIAWADDTTRAHGDFSAQGGAQGGHGGLIETSGKRALDVTHARVNASAPKGSNGSWLLDPSDVYIVHGSAGALSGGVFDPNLPTSIGDTEINAALNGGTNVSIQTSSGIGGTGAIVINGSADAGGAVAISNTSSGPRELRLNTTGTINMHAGASIAGSFSHPLDVIMLAGAGASSIGGSINTLGQVTIASSGTLSVGAITTTLPSNNYSWDLTLRAPALTIHDNIQAKNASLQADNPITVLAGKTVIASNDLQFVNFTNSNPMIVSATGLVNVGDLSVLSGAGVFKAPTFDFYSGSTLTVNGAPVGLSGIRLFGTNITINDNLLTTSTVSLSADNPITVATGKTVIASNGAATNPYGHLYFSPYTYSNPLTVGSTGLVNVANLSPLSGTGVFRSSSLGFGSGGLLTVNTAPVGFNQISLNAPTITINDSILATSSVSLQADNPLR